MLNSTRISRRAGAALFVFMGLLATPWAASAQAPAGHWDGQVDLPSGPLDVHLDLTHTGTAWSGSIVIPTESVKSMPLKNVTVSGRHVSFGVDVQGGPTFTGTFDKKDTRMGGTFSQAGFDYRFRLKRVVGTRAASGTGGVLSSGRAPGC